MTKQAYQDIRQHPANYPSHIVALAGFCASYNAKWFGGYAGIVTTKTGVVRNYYDEAIRNVIAQVPHIMDVHFECRDFFSLDCSGAVLYCDPPYRNTTGYHNIFDSNAYWQKIRQLSKTNLVFCSEYSAPDDFIPIWQQKIITTLDHDSRSIKIEKLFVQKEVVWKK